MRPLIAAATLSLLAAGVARAERPLEAYDAYQGRFYLRLGAECIQRSGPDPACFELLETSLDFDPRAPIVHFTLGKYYAALGDLSRATGAFARALELDGDLLAALIALGDVYLLRGDVAQARTYYQRFMDRAPADPMGPYSLGASYAQELDEARALELLERAIALGFADAAAVTADPRWRNVVGSPRLDALLAPLPQASPPPSQP